MSDDMETEEKRVLPVNISPSEGTDSKVEPLSKNQQKKLLRNEKNEEQKLVKRQWERERKKARRLEARLAGKDLGKEKREANAREKHIVPAKVVIDLSFDELMTAKERQSMTQQLSSLYNTNKRSSHPFSSIVFCGPANQALFETGIGSHMQIKMGAQWQRWQSVILREKGGLEDIHKDQESVPKICNQDELVYLSADSESTLDRIEEGKAYIIGGLVDRNRHKNLCHQKAEKLGIKTAKLPIDADRLTASTVLTVNQVVEILLAFNETLEWETTLDRCLPKRKTKEQEEKQIKSLQDERTT